MPAQADACLLRLLYACSGCCSPGHNTPYCIARQTQPTYLSAIQTHPSSLSRAISRYNTLSHNTIWAVAHPNFCCIFFFSFFTINFFFYYFQLLENHPKIHIHIYIFFSFSSLPNKFIKIYFHSFFCSFTPCKNLENNFYSPYYYYFFFIMDQFVQNFSTFSSHTTPSVQP